MITYSPPIKLVLVRHEPEVVVVMVTIFKRFTVMMVIIILVIFDVLKI